MEVKKVLRLFVIIITICSCQKKSFIEEYYTNGKIKKRTQVNERGIKNGFYKEFYNSGELKQKMNYADGQIEDTVYYYYKNGEIKEKGILYNNDLKIDWWSYYDSLGVLKSKKEYKILKDNRMYKNQTIYFNRNGNIDNTISSFFTIDLSDTLILGRNSGYLKYNSNFKDAYKSMLGVVIENEYSDREIKKDSFYSGTNSVRIGIFAHKTGRKTIRGYTLETLFYKEEMGNDSVKGSVVEHKKYFKKSVYVKDTINGNRAN